MNLIKKIDKSIVGRLNIKSPILGSNIKRIGLLRTFVGGLPMYLCIPFLILFHYTVSLILFQLFVCPFFKTPKLNWRNYIIIDRNRIKELSWIDKLNCNFCGYANGITTMINIELDNVSKSNAKLPIIKKVILIFILILYTPFLVFYELHISILYNIMIAIPLGMNTYSYKEAMQVINNANFYSYQNGFLKVWFKTFKNQTIRFVMCLEQIESSWCPLTHFEKKQGIVYPKHHENFLGPNEIEKLKKIISTEGSVSNRKPRY